MWRPYGSPKSNTLHYFHWKQPAPSSLITTSRQNENLKTPSECAAEKDSIQAYLCHVFVALLGTRPLSASLKSSVLAESNTAAQAPSTNAVFPFSPQLYEQVGEGMTELLRPLGGDVRGFRSITQSYGQWGSLLNTWMSRYLAGTLDRSGQHSLARDRCTLRQTWCQKLLQLKIAVVQSMCGLWLWSHGKPRIRGMLDEDRRWKWMASWYIPNIRMWMGQSGR